MVSIIEIPQNKSTITLSEKKLAVIYSWLKKDLISFYGGEELAEWIRNNLGKIEDIFGSDDRVFFKMKNPLANKELIEFVLDKKIGDSVEWIQFKDDSRWWLYIYWSVHENDIENKKETL